MVIDTVTRFVHRLSPTYADSDATRRARLVLWFAVVLETQVVAFSSLYVAIGAPIVAVFVLAVGLTLTSTPWVLKRFSTPVASHWVVTQLVIVLNVIAWHTGGLHAPALYWTTAAPVLATMVTGRRSGLAWLGVTMANAGAFYAVEFFDVAALSVLKPAMADVLTWVAVGGLAFVIFAVAASYESTTAVMMTSLDQANKEMRHLLDNVAEGFFTAKADAVPSSQHTRALTTWFGKAPERPLWEWLGAEDAAFRQAVALSWPDVFEDVMPVDVVLDQMPRQFRAGHRTFAAEWRPLHDAKGAVQQVMVFVSDVTNQVAADSAERVMRERATLFERLSSDRRGFIVFFDECEQLLASLTAANTNPLSALHTLKGISALYGCDSVAKHCHALETHLVETGEPLTADDHAALMKVWSAATSRVAQVLQEERTRMTVTTAEVARLVRDLQTGVQSHQLATRVASWTHTPTRDVFARLAEQASALSERLGKTAPRIEFDDAGVRLEPTAWQGVFASLVHVVRNAVDHGFESPAEREATGKTSEPLLRFVSRQEGHDVVIEIGDDGRGVDWDRVRQRAAATGLPASSHEDLVRALFSERFSTAEEVTDISGRGVGMTALAEACAALTASIEIESATRGAGTLLRIRCPPSQSVKAAA